MNRIDYIEINNVKGKEKLVLNFEELYANKPNLLVAPNGFGKSTIAQAFSAIKPTKIELKRDDVYKADTSKKACVKVNLSGDYSGLYVVDENKNDFNNCFDIKVINNAVVAKSHYSTAGAQLKVEPIVIYSTIPVKKDIGYSFLNIVEEIGCQRKILINLTSYFNNIVNLYVLKENKEHLKRSYCNFRAKTKIDNFISNISSEGTAEEIKENISSECIEELLSESCIKKVYSAVSEHIFDTLESKIDIVLNCIQIIFWYGINIQNDTSFLDKLIKYKKYKENRKILDERLKLFNTTGREIKTEKDGNKIVVKFENSNAMSNGERDVLVFLTELFNFENSMKNNKAILIIDEIFDYLDGSNLLVAQYYLASFINSCKNSQKIIFPIIFTHLDPELFNNYYFSDKKIHYLVDIPNDCINSNIVKVIQNRCVTDEDDFVSKYLLHFHYDDKSIPQTILDNTDGNFPTTSKHFQEKAYNEVLRYLNGEKYNPILVTVGIRVKVEEIAFNNIETSKREEFVNTHTTIKKLSFVNEYVELPEELFMLQPLYNDTLHLNNNSNQTKRKIKSCSLKLYNNPIKNIIRIIFE